VAKTSSILSIPNLSTSVDRYFHRIRFGPLANSCSALYRVGASFCFFQLTTNDEVIMFIKLIHRNRPTILHNLGFIHDNLQIKTVLLADHTYTQLIPSASVQTFTVSRFYYPGTHSPRGIILRDPTIQLPYSSKYPSLPSHPRRCSTDVGDSIGHRAPEAILTDTTNLSNDTWSLGCILIELVTGDLLPFLTTDLHVDVRVRLAIMEKISAAKLDSKLWDKLTEGLPVDDVRKSL